MTIVDVNINIAQDGFYAAYCADHPSLFGGGETPASALAELKETLRILKEDIGKEAAALYPVWLDGEYEFIIHYDVRSFLEYYSGVITLTALGRLSGIHPKQLWAYANGVSKPRKAQVQKIESALHKLGSELQAVSFC